MPYVLNELIEELDKASDTFKGQAMSRMCHLISFDVVSFKDLSSSQTFIGVLRKILSNLNKEFSAQLSQLLNLLSKSDDLVLAFQKAGLLQIFQNILLDQKHLFLHPVINIIVERLLHLPAEELIKNSSILCKSYEKAKIFHFPLVYLSATDRQVLNSFHKSLSNQNSSSKRKALIFFQDLILNEFPCEIFQQRPIFVRHLLNLILEATISQKSDQLTIASLSSNCLQSLIKAFKSKILSEYLFSVISPVYENNVEISSSSCSCESDSNEIRIDSLLFHDSPVRNSLLTGSQPNATFRDMNALSQLNTDHYPSSSSSKNSLPLNGRYELSIQALCCHIIRGSVNAVMAVINSETHPSELFSFLNDSLSLIYHSIDLFLLSCDPLRKSIPDLSSTEFTFESPPTEIDLIKPWELASIFYSLMHDWSQVILHLLLTPQKELKPVSSLVSFSFSSSFYLFISRIFTPETAAGVLLEQAKDCLTVMLFRLPQCSPEIRKLISHEPTTAVNQLASYVKLINPTAHQLYETSIGLADGFQALFHLNDASLSEVEGLRDTFLRSICAFELFQSQEIAKIFVSFLSKCSQASSLTCKETVDDFTKDCTLRFLTHANTRVRRNFHEALAQHCKQCICVTSCSQPNNECFYKIYFLISSREIMAELIEFGAWDLDSRTRFHAREVLVALLDSNTLLPDDKFALLCETVLGSSELKCSSYSLPLVISLGLLIRGSDQQVVTSEVCKETWALNLKLSDVALKWCTGYYDRFARSNVLHQLCLLWHPSAEVRRDFARLVSNELHSHWSKEAHKQLFSPLEDSSRHVSGSSNFSGKADWSHPDARSTPLEDQQKIFPVEPAKITKALVDSLLLNNFCHSEDSDLAPSGICDSSSVPSYLLSDLEHYTQNALSQSEPIFLREQALHSLINLFLRDNANISAWLKEFDGSTLLVQWLLEATRQPNVRWSAPDLAVEIPAGAENRKTSAALASSWLRLLKLVLSRQPSVRWSLSRDTNVIMALLRVLLFHVTDQITYANAVSCLLLLTFHGSIQPGSNFCVISLPQSIVQGYQLPWHFPSRPRPDRTSQTSSAIQCLGSLINDSPADCSDLQLHPNSSLARLAIAHISRLFAQACFQDALDCNLCFGIEAAQVAIAKCIGSKGKPLLAECLTSQLLQNSNHQSTFQFLSQEREKAAQQMHKIVNRPNFVKLSLEMGPEMCFWQSPFSLLFQLFGSGFDQAFDHSAYCIHFLFCQFLMISHQMSLNVSRNGISNGVLDGWFTKSRLDQFFTALPASSIDFKLLQILLSLVQQFALSDSFQLLPNGVQHFLLGSREQILCQFFKCIGSNSSLSLLLLRSASCGVHPEKGKTDSARLIRSRNRLLHQFLPQFLGRLTSKQSISPDNDLFPILLNWGAAVLRDAKSNPYADLSKVIYVCETLANLLPSSPTDVNLLAELCYLLKTAFELMSTYDAERDRLVDCFMGCAILHPLAHLAKVLASLLVKASLKSLASFWRTLSNPHFLFRFLLYRSLQLRADSLAILGQLVLIPTMQPLLCHLARVYRKNFSREAQVTSLTPSWPQCEDLRSPLLHNPLFSIAFTMSASDCVSVRCEAYKLLISLIQVSPLQGSFLTIAPSFYEKHRHTLKDFATPPPSDHNSIDLTLNCSEISASTNNNSLPNHGAGGDQEEPDMVYVYQERLFSELVETFQLLHLSRLFTTDLANFMRDSNFFRFLQNFVSCVLLPDFDFHGLVAETNPSSSSSSSVEEQSISLQTNSNHPLSAAEWTNKFSNHLDKYTVHVYQVPDNCCLPTFTESESQLTVLGRLALLLSFTNDHSFWISIRHQLHCFVCIQNLAFASSSSDPSNSCQPFGTPSKLHASSLLAENSRIEGVSSQLCIASILDLLTVLLNRLPFVACRFMTSNEELPCPEVEEKSSFSSTLAEARNPLTICGLLVNMIQSDLILSKLVHFDTSRSRKHIVIAMHLDLHLVSQCFRLLNMLLSMDTRLALKMLNDQRFIQKVMRFSQIPLSVLVNDSNVISFMVEFSSFVATLFRYTQLERQQLKSLAEEQSRFLHCSSSEQITFSGIAISVRAFGNKICDWLHLLSMAIDAVLERETDVGRVKLLQHLLGMFSDVFLCHPSHFEAANPAVASLDKHADQQPVTGIFEKLFNLMKICQKHRFEARSERMDLLWSSLTNCLRIVSAASLKVKNFLIKCDLVETLIISSSVLSHSLLPLNEKNCASLELMRQELLNNVRLLNNLLFANQSVACPRASAANLNQLILSLWKVSQEDDQFLQVLLTCVMNYTADRPSLATNFISHTESPTLQANNELSKSLFMHSLFQLVKNRTSTVERLSDLKKRSKSDIDLHLHILCLAFHVLCNLCWSQVARNSIQKAKFLYQFIEKEVKCFKRNASTLKILLFWLQFILTLTFTHEGQKLLLQSDSIVSNVLQYAKSTNLPIPIRNSSLTIIRNLCFNSSLKSIVISLPESESSPNFHIGSESLLSDNGDGVNNVLDLWHNILMKAAQQQQPSQQQPLIEFSIAVDSMASLAFQSAKIKQILRNYRNGIFEKYLDQGLRHLRIHLAKTGSSDENFAGCLSTGSQLLSILNKSSFSL